MRVSNLPLHFSGAGILLIELYKTTPCFVFFGRSVMFADTGGISNKNETSHKTAQRECLEETANLVYIHSRFLKHYIIIKNYISYIVYVTGLSYRDYIKNTRITRKTCSHDWNETSDMVRVPLNDVKLNSLPIVLTYDNRKILLRQRTVDIIKKLFENKKNFQKLLSQPIQLTKHINLHHKNKCLNGTVTYS